MSRQSGAASPAGNAFVQAQKRAHACRCRGSPASCDR